MNILLIWAGVNSDMQRPVEGTPEGGFYPGPVQSALVTTSSTMKTLLLS